MIAGRARVDDRFVKDETPMTPERKARIEALRKKRDELIKLRESQKKDNREIMRKTVMHSTGDVAVTPQDSIVHAPKNLVYDNSIVEVQPKFPDGITKFYDYFNSNFKVAEENKDITGKLIFSFIVDTDGSLTNIKLLRGINSSIDEEAIKALKSSPKWIPGEQNGQKVKVLYSIPIKITAQ